MTNRLTQNISTLLILPWLCFSGALLSETLPTQAISSPNQLKDNVREFVLHAFPQMVSDKNEMQVEVTDLDPRFKLSPCDNPLTFSMTQDMTEETLAGRHNVNVHCDTPSTWTVYIPVNINVWQEIAVLATARKRGDTIREQDIVMQKQNIATLYNRRFIKDTAQIAGKVTTRSLAAGSVLYAELLIEPDMVKKGDQVVLMVQSANITVSSMGKAQQSGKQGDQINVENLTSNRTLTGRIIGKNTVSLSL